MESGNQQKQKQKSNSTMSGDNIPAILDLEAFSFEDLHTTTVGDGADKKKVKLPYLDMDNMEEDADVYILHWCDYVVSKLRTCGHDREEDYFPAVQTLLAGGAQSNFNRHYDAVPNGTPLSLDLLKATLRHLVEDYLTEDDRIRQLEWFRSADGCRKPTAMPVSTFKERLDRNARLMHHWMPGNVELSATEAKMCFHKGMPRSWQDDFIRLRGPASKDENTMDIMIEQYKNLETVAVRNRIVENRKRKAEKKKKAETVASRPMKQQTVSFKKGTKKAPPPKAAGGSLNYCRQNKCQAEGAVPHLWSDCPNNWANQKPKGKGGPAKRKAREDVMMVDDDPPPKRAKVLKNKAKVKAATHKPSRRRAESDARYKTDSDSESSGDEGFLADIYVDEENTAAPTERKSESGENVCCMHCDAKNHNFSHHIDTLFCEQTTTISGTTAMKTSLRNVSADIRSAATIHAPRSRCVPGSKRQLGTNPHATPGRFTRAFSAFIPTPKSKSEGSYLHEYVEDNKLSNIDLVNLQKQAEFVYSCALLGEFDEQIHPRQRK